MYKIGKRIVKSWPVTITEADDGGKIAKREVKVDFEVLTQPELDQLYAGGGNDVDLLERVTVGWGDGEFQDEDGAPLLFNPESKAKLWARTNVRSAFVASFLAAFNGREAPRKN